MAKKKIVHPKNSKPKKPKPALALPDAKTQPECVLGIQQVCEVLHLREVREFPPPPSSRPGYVTLCDPGLSVLDIRAQHSRLFYSNDWYQSQAFAKERVPWCWLQIRVSPLEPGKPFDEQSDGLTDGETPAPARAIVTLLVVHFLATKGSLDIGRLRSADVLPSGQRVLVGPFGPRGIELATCADRYTSPSVGLSAAFTFGTRQK